MKKLLLILLCLPIIGFGQGWEVTFGGTDNESARSVHQTTDSGYIIVGKEGAGNSSNYDIYLIKTDSNGIEQWNQTLIGGINGSDGYSVQQTTDGGYIITGRNKTLTGDGYTNGNVYLIKTDANGIEQWNKDIDGYYNNNSVPANAYGTSVQQTTDGGYIIGGTAETYIFMENQEINIIKTNSSGNIEWDKTYGLSGDDEGNSIQQTSDGGYIIAGRMDALSSLTSNVYLLKIDQNGFEEWSQLFGNSGYEYANSVQQSSDGGYIITGAIGLTDSDVYLIKTDTNGVLQWNRNFGGTGNDYGHSVQQTTDGGYIIAGSTASFGNGLMDVYLIKTDSNGIEQWNQTFGGTDYDMGYSVQQTDDGGYIITGSTGSFGNGGSDVYLIKTDDNGNVTSTFNIPINPNRKLEKTIDLLGKETKPQTNTPFIEIYDDGTVEKKITID